MLKAVGKLKYCDNFKLIVEVDNDISNFYLSLIPKYTVKPNKQRYDAHITVSRKETPTKLKNWAKYEDKEIAFTYSPDIQTDGIYYWLNVYSEELEDIRLELGLHRRSRLSKPPNGEKSFHITIGNTK